MVFGVLGGCPVALVSMIYAFHRGSGRMAAVAAYVLVAVVTILVTSALSTYSPVPLVCGVIGVSALGYYAYLTRHRGPPEERRRAWSDFVSIQAPTSKPVTIADVVGAWRFYLDAAGQTVDLVFHRDGTFSQTLTGNLGGRRECPGGTWKLDGPHIELDSYQSAWKGTLGSVRWWFGDTAGGFALFGSDHPDLGVMHRISKIA